MIIDCFLYPAIPSWFVIDAMYSMSLVIFIDDSVFIRIDSCWYGRGTTERVQVHKGSVISLTLKSLKFQVILSDLNTANGPPLVIM